MKILVLDDDPGLLATLGDILQVTGFAAHLAPTGSQGLAYVEQHDIDVALIDLRLDDMSGLDVMRRIKALSPDTECILLTGHASRASAIEAINLGAFSYLQKPFDMDQLLLAIRRAGERRAASRDLAESQARYHAFLDATTDCAFLKDDQFRYIVCNQAKARFLGRAIPEIIGQNDFELTAPHIAQQCRESDLRALAENQAVTTVEIVGDRVYETCKFPVPLQNGRVGVGGYARDITESQRLLEQTRYHADRASALLETSLALTSLDLEAILRAMAGRAMSLFAADGCRVFLLEPDGQTLRCALALGEDPAAFADLKVSLGSGVTGAVAASGKAEIVNDMLNDPRAAQVPGTEVEPEAIMFAPLQEHERILGVINVRRAGSERPFEPADLDLLQAFAALVSAAVARSHLFQSERHQRQLSDALRDALSAGASLGASLDVDTILDRLLESLHYVVPFEGGCIMAVSPKGGQVRIARTRGYNSFDAPQHNEIQQLVFDIASTANLNWMFKNKSPLIIPDVREYPGWLSTPGLQFTRSWAGAPILVNDKVIAFFSLDSTISNFFAAEHLALIKAFAGQASLALQNARLFEETEKRLQFVSALHNIDMAIAASLDLQLTLHFILDQALTHLRVDAAAIQLISANLPELRFVAGRGFTSAQVHKSRLRVSDVYTDTLLIQRQPVHLPNIQQAQPDFGRQALVAAEGFVSYIAHPLIAKGQVKGLLEAFGRQELETDGFWMESLEALAGQAALAIDNAEMFEGLQRANLDLSVAYDATIQGWSKALDLRDEETEGHTQRVTELTMRLAQRMGISDDDLVHIRRGALLHDIGKVGIPDHILLKPGALTCEEWQVMRRHPVYAHDLISEIDYLRPALDIPYAHHEKWDGTGYPRGLQGPRIPLSARVFAVVDVWDALTSDRPYRPAWSSEEARDYIRKQAGKHFDPEVAATFLEMLEAAQLQA